MRAPLPANESARLQALRDYRLLDTAPERDYDELADLAARLTDAPMAAVSLIDRDRQWFKAARGLDVRETSRDSAFCAHAILDPDAPLIVSDATKDVRFADNPLVLRPDGIRSYAGVPLRAMTGEAVGTMCVIDRKPRSFSAEQLRALRIIARQVNRLMDLRRTAAALAEALEKVKVLEGLLPTCAYCKSIRDEAGRWQPMELYIGERTRSQFSHGICPTCAARHFPDFDLSGGNPPAQP